MVQRQGQGIPPAGRGMPWLRGLVDVRPGEVRALFLSAAYFFFLLCGYYILRPLRDEMGVAGGVRQLQWLFTGTFVAMLAAVPLFGALVSRYPRHTFLPVVYRFFALNLLLFFALLQADVSRVVVARAFFIWASVFNLFVVSVFWSYMADIFSSGQGKRLFGFVAAGGTAGALVGPALTALLAAPLGTANLLLISAVLLEAAVWCIRGLGGWARPAADAEAAAAAPERAAEAAMGGGILAGVRLVVRSPYLLGICAYLLLYTATSTFLYFEQAHIVRAYSDDPARRTAVFAGIDLLVNALTIAVQVAGTGRLLLRWGVGVALALLPVVTGAGFLVLGLAPGLLVLAGFQGLRRALNYGVARPAREVLYTVVGREEKYKSKNFIDTVVYRGGDAVSGWLFAGLKAAGLGLVALALLAVPVAALWAAVGAWLGRRQEALQAARPPATETAAATAP